MFDACQSRGRKQRIKRRMRSIKKGSTPDEQAHLAQQRSEQARETVTNLLKRREEKIVRKE